MPRIAGILAIVFSGLGIFGSAIWAFGPLSDIGRWDSAGELGAISTWLWLWFALSLGLFGAHLTGGILACMYKTSGLRLLNVYAIGALVLIVTDILLGFTLLPSHASHRIRESVTYMRVIFDILATPWPIVVLCLVNARGARAACAG
ncbi:MAG: hypothetical protein H6Q90_114 [Deltaproteobacteria bacterium]|nr:hypothetical protein [Deltaproteobacteria bacterium]